MKSDIKRDREWVFLENLIKKNILSKEHLKKNIYMKIKII